jgi:glycosyltransferase involved in cell wall biosynthesis
MSVMTSDRHIAAPSRRTPAKEIAFVTTFEFPAWGGCEELWSRSALDLKSRGVSVSASVYGWFPPHERILTLAQAGVRLQFRPAVYPFWKRVWHKVSGVSNPAIVVEVQKFLASGAPALVVLSGGGALPHIGLLELCFSKGLPFVTIGHANCEDWWPEDELAARYRKVLPAARRCYFVAKANQMLLEKQIGYEFPNAEVVRNPFNVARNASPPWPLLGRDSTLRLACVGRLEPVSKGQHLLLEALADPVWRSRSWQLTLYGEGRQRNILERLVLRFALEDRVVFAGFVGAVDKIWAENHVLVLPSRHEGLPLAMVEAMLCARPVVATDVAGHSEIIEDGVTGFLANAPTVSSIGGALERLWNRRSDLEAMGRAAANSIREHVPSDPVRIFSEKLGGLIGHECGFTSRDSRPQGPDL